MTDSGADVIRTMLARSHSWGWAVVWNHRLASPVMDTPESASRNSFCGVPQSPVPVLVGRFDPDLRVSVITESELAVLGPCREPKP
jgi:hypothetical protein